MRRSATLLAILAALALVASSCGGDEGDQAGRTPTPGTAGATVTISASTFNPKELTVKAGTTVVWEHADTLPHTVTADDDSFDSSLECASVGDGEKCLNSGDTFEQTFDAPGRIPYHCKIHGAPGGVGQAGVIIVQ